MSKWTLWVVSASNGKYGELTHIYARDEQHARERAKPWLESHPELVEVTFRSFPGGFQIVRSQLPGVLEFPD